MARRAGAIPAAGMLQVEAEIQRNIQKRFGLPMPLVRQFAALEFNRLTEREEGYLGHINDYTGLVP